MTGDGDANSLDLWRRWDTEDEVPFSAYCALPGRDPVSERGGDDAVDLRICSGVERAFLRYAPTVVVVLGLFLLAVTITTGGVTVPEVSVDPVAVVGLVAGAAWVGVLAALLRSVGLLQGDSAERAVAYHLIGLVLAVAVAVSTAVALGGDARGLTAVANGNDWAFVLVLYVGGPLVYDGLVLRAEHLFARLGETGIVPAGEPYDDFVADLQADLERTVDVPALGAVPVRYAFAVTFVSVFVAAGLANAPRATALVKVLALAVPVFVLVVLTFQFLILIRHFYLLLSERYRTADGEGIVLRYDPFNPDEHGGFRDLGRFALRVNVVILLGGAYAVYRVYVSYVAGAPDPAASAEFLAWSIDAAGPLVAYLLVALLWFYYSFWQIHRRMERGKHRLLSEYYARVGTPTPYEDGNGERHRADGGGEASWDEIAAVRESPEWPLNVSALAGLFSADLIPLVLSLLPFA